MLTDGSHEDADFIFEKQYMVNAQNRHVDEDVFVDVSYQTLPLSRWTTVSGDDALMNHLLKMLFTWDNIVERAIYRPIFEEDVMGMDSHTDYRAGSFC